MNPFLNTAEAILRGFGARVVLSVLILASLVPKEPTPGVTAFFLLFFGAEASLRLLLLIRHIRRGTWTKSAVALLLIDIIATCSFLPTLTSGARLLRWGRVARLVLLLAYWGPLLRDFIRVGLQRERLSQMLLVGGLATLLSGIGAALLRAVNASGTDFTGDGVANEGARNLEFFDLLWWSVRQVGDPGNLVASTGDSALLVISLALTSFGLLLVAFLIGIGTTLVEDLLKASQQRHVGLRDHTVVLNVNEDGQGVLEQIPSYFQKQIRWRKVALLGERTERPPFLDNAMFRSFYYRHGNLSNLEALTRLDISEARRVAILANRRDPESDAAVISATLSCRTLSANAWIVAELNRPTNIPAALQAGQAHTIPVPAGRLASLVLIQALLNPSRARVLEELVSLERQELYTTILGDGLLDEFPNELPFPSAFEDIRRALYEQHGCLLIGYLAAGDHASNPWLWELNPVLERDPQPGEKIRGLIGIAARFDDLRYGTEAVATHNIFYTGNPPQPMSFEIRDRQTPPIKRLLILGFHDDIVEAICEFMRTSPVSQITVVGDDEAMRDRMRHAFLTERMHHGGTFQLDHPKLLHLALPNGEKCGHVHLRVADRYADGLFRKGDATGRVGNVFDYDALMMLADDGDTRDRDASTVLGVLKLLDRWQLEEGSLHTVVAEFADKDKSLLLEARAATHPCAPHFAFVHSDALRNRILNHSFFVPGLPPVLYHLLTCGGHEIVSLDISGRTGTFRFYDLIHTLTNSEAALLPIALVHIDASLHINPSAHATYRWEDFHTLHCIGQRPRPGGRTMP